MRRRPRSRWPREPAATIRFCRHPVQAARCGPMWDRCPPRSSRSGEGRETTGATCSTSPVPSGLSPSLWYPVRSLPGVSGGCRGDLRTSGLQQQRAPAPRWLQAGGVGGAGGAGLVPTCTSSPWGQRWTRTEPLRAQGLHFCRIALTCTWAGSRSRREIHASPWWEEGRSASGSGGVESRGHGAGQSRRIAPGRPEVPRDGARSGSGVPGPRETSEASRQGLEGTLRRKTV